jgi:ferredoxin
MTFRIEIDERLCSGFGTCVQGAAAVFELGAGGKARLRVADSDDPNVLDAAASCPMGAIAVFDSVTGDPLA